MNPKRHRTPGRPAAPILTVLALLFALVPGVAAAPESIDAVDPSPSARQKMHGGLEELVTRKWSLDPRFADLVPGYAAGEIPFFAVLSVAPDAARRSTLQSLGVRILRRYRTVDAFALVGRPGAVTRVAGLSWVRWMTPVEVVVALDDEEVGPQNRATTGDVGAPVWWDRGITGAGIRIAVLDTGLDYTVPEAVGVAGQGHPGLDDLDFRHWSALPGAPKVVQMRDFNGGGCRPFAGDGHGHGTHVAGIATGTGEGGPTSEPDGTYTGIAPDAELAVGKVLTDAGAGLNSDLLGAMEWAAMPEGSAPCAIGAHIVNLSLGSESRPNRINTGHDVDMVSLVLNGLATRYGTLFVVAAGNSGPFNGSVLETPGHASQALSVAATAKDYDLNRDDTLSGDACAGYQHPNEPGTPDNDCADGDGTQRSSISSFSSRGPSAGMWQKPDIAAPGYNIVSAQSSTGAALLANDLNVGTRDDPLYATATGTSMASPATAGSAALLLQAYLERHGTMPTGSAGMGTRRVRAHALLKAALMNSANSSLYESRWILNFAAGTEDDLANCPDNVIPFGLCAIVDLFTNFATGANTLYEVRNRAADPFVGPWAGGAGKLQLSGAINALRSGVVMYSALMSTATFFDPGHRDFQGVWNVGPVPAGAGRTQRFVLHAAPGIGPVTASFRFVGGRPSDGSSAIPSGAAPDAWDITLPGTTTIPRGGDVTVSMRMDIPASTGAGMYTGAVLASLSNGQTIRIPVSAFVPLHDPNGADGNAPGPQARIASAADVFAKDDTTWPSLVGTAGTGANADWLVYRANLGAGLAEAVFRVYDATAAGDETYDLYLYDTDFNLIKSTHPFTSEGSGVTDQTANDGRPATPESSPQELTLGAPARGRYFLVVNRAKVGGTSTGDFGQFVLTLDEVVATP